MSGPERLPLECFCPCHRAPGLLKHAVACCSKCLMCGRRIRTGCMTEHVGLCFQRNRERESANAETKLAGAQ